MKYPEVKNYIGEELQNGSSNKLDVYSPVNGEVISKVFLSTYEAIDKAVKTASEAFPSWSETPIKERVQVFFRYRNLLEKNLDELSEIVHEENGKTIEEAKAEVAKSIELTEFACSMPQLIAGEILEVSKGVECRLEHFPLGVVASITPFNFPNMVPTWKFQMRLFWEML